MLNFKSLLSAKPSFYMNSANNAGNQCNEHKQSITKTIEKQFDLEHSNVPDKFPSVRIIVFFNCFGFLNYLSSTAKYCEYIVR